MDSVLVMNFEEGSELDKIQFDFTTDDDSKIIYGALEPTSAAVDWEISPISMPDSPDSNELDQHSFNSNPDLLAITSEINQLQAFSTSPHSAVGVLESPVLLNNGLSLEIPTSMFYPHDSSTDSPFYASPNTFNSPQSAMPYGMNINHLPLFVNTYDTNVTVNAGSKSAPPSSFSFFNYGETSPPSGPKPRTKSDVGKKKKTPKRKHDSDVLFGLEGGGEGIGEDETVTCSHEDCGKIFTSQSSLKSHFKIHLPERNFACDSCDSTFRRSHDLKRHYRSLHTGIYIQ